MCHTASRTGADSLPRSAPGALTPPPTATEILNVKTFLDCMWKAVDTWSFYETKVKKPSQNVKNCKQHHCWDFLYHFGFK